MDLYSENVCVEIIDKENTMQHADKIDVFVAMKAGKMIPQADSRLFAADPRKGWIRVLMDSQDLLHFQWLHRDETDASFAAPSSDHAANSAAGELDVIVFPGEAVFEKVSSRDLSSSLQAPNALTRTNSFQIICFLG
jgi:hypothetical protein